MGCVHIKFEITKEQYERAKSGNYDGMISDSEFMGYGVYCIRATEEDGKYYLSYDRGSSCD